jgi:aspartate kinase
MKRLVIKFGGTSVMSTRRIQNAAAIALEQQKRGYAVTVVVSAMGHTTDHLIGLACDISKAPIPREMDSLLSTGEQISATLMAMAINESGGKARSLSGADAGIVTNDWHTDAEILSVQCAKVESLLSDGVIPVVAGFQGITSAGDITTLGRGGSDTTAIALAAALHAERCDIYSDVQGVYSADPNRIENAFMLDAIAYDEMAELAANGAQVLCLKSVLLAQKHNIAVRVRSTFHPENEGTLLTRTATQINRFTGMACTTKQNCFQLLLPEPIGADKSAARAFRHRRSELRRQIVSMLLECGIEVESAASVKNGFCMLSFIVNKADADIASIILKTAMEEHAQENIKLDVHTNVAKISIVASEVSSDFEIETVKRLAAERIPITVILAKKKRLSLFVPEHQTQLALQVLHVNFCELPSFVA